MTTVVALQGKGWASIACDSRATEGPRPYTLPKEVCKVVKNGPYLIGVTGDLQHIPLIEYSFSPTSPQTDISVKELDRFMTTVFIPEYRDFLKETSMNTKEDADISVPGALVLINGIIYKISTAIQARKGGRAIEDTMAEVFAPEPQPEAPTEQTPGDMSQEGEQPGTQPQGGMIPPVGGAQAPDVQQAPPDIQSIMARLTSGGKATGSATTTSQNRG